MTQVTVNGNVYSDDGSTSKDMGNGGHRLHLLPMIRDVVAVVDTIADQAEIVELVQTAVAAAATAGENAEAAEGYAASAAAVGPNLAEQDDPAKGAALVGYKGRTVAARLADIVSVKDFGAVGDGVTDDTGAFVGAAAASLHVSIPAGNYKITSGTLNFSTPVRFVGQGREQTQIICSSGTGNLFAWSSNVTGGGIENVKIVAIGMTGGDVIRNDGQSRFTVSGLQIVGGYNGIFMSNFNCVFVHDVWINALIGLYAIKLYSAVFGSADVADISNVQIGFQSPSSSSSPSGVIIDGGVATVSLRHVAVVNALNSFVVSNSPNSTGPHFVTGLDIQSDFSYSEGLRIDGGSGATRNHNFTDVYIHGSKSSNNIYLSPTSSYITVKGGQISGAHLRGVFISSEYTFLTNCQIASNSQSSSGAYPGVYIGPESYSTVITGNSIGHWSGHSAASHSYGVEVASGAQAYTITGNNLLGNVNGEIIDNAHDNSSCVFGNIKNPAAQSYLSGPITSISGDLTMRGAGSSAVSLGNANGPSFVAQSADVSTVNYVKVYGHAAGSSPAIQSAGDDQNIDLTILGKGTGTIQFGGTGSFAANGTVATTLTGVGPAGSSATVRQWMVIKDNSGALMYIPCF